jgi:hypothetical protein
MKNQFSWGMAKRDWYTSIENNVGSIRVKGIAVFRCYIFQNE